MLMPNPGREREREREEKIGRISTCLVREEMAMRDKSDIYGAAVWAVDKGRGSQRRQGLMSNSKATVEGSTLKKGRQESLKNLVEQLRCYGKQLAQS